MATRNPFTAWFTNLLLLIIVLLVGSCSARAIYCEWARCPLNIQIIDPEDVGY